MRLITFLSALKENTEMDPRFKRFLGLNESRDEIYQTAVTFATQTRDEMLAAGTCSAYEINNGECADWTDTFNRKMNDHYGWSFEKEVQEMGAGPHVFSYVKPLKMFFDAEAVKGVRDWRNLPLYQKWKIKDWKEWGDEIEQEWGEKYLKTPIKEVTNLNESPNTPESGWIFGDGHFEAVDHPKDWHHADILYAQYEKELENLDPDEMPVETAEGLAYGGGGIRVIGGVNWADPSRRHFFGVWEKPSKPALATLIELVQISKASEFSFGWFTTMGEDETSQLSKEEALVFLSGQSSKITEAPIRDFEVGNLDVPKSSFGKRDQAMLTNPKIADIARKRIKTLIPLDLYFVAMSAPSWMNKSADAYADNKYDQVKFNDMLMNWEGVIAPDTVQVEFGVDIKPEPDAITVIYLSNANSIDSIPMTPWIMMHRLGHAIESAARGNELGAEAENAYKEIKRYTEATGFIQRNSIKSFLSMKSARNAKVQQGEAFPEMLAQYLYTGRVKLQRAVHHWWDEESAAYGFGHQYDLADGRNIGAKNDYVPEVDDPLEHLNYDIAYYEDNINEAFEIILGAAIGRLLAAP